MFGGRNAAGGRNQAVVGQRLSSGAAAQLQMVGSGWHSSRCYSAQLTNALKRQPRLL